MIIRWYPMLIFVVLTAGCISLPEEDLGPLVTVVGTIQRHSDGVTVTTCKCAKQHVFSRGNTALRLLAPDEVAGQDIEILHKNAVNGDSPWRKIGATYEFAMPKVFLKQIWRGAASTNAYYTLFTTHISGALKNIGESNN